MVCSEDKGTWWDSLESLKGCGNRDFIGPGREEKEWWGRVLGRGFVWE